MTPKEPTDDLTQWVEHMPRSDTYLCHQTYRKLGMGYAITNIQGIPRVEPKFTTISQTQTQQ